ncbi:hypothetical protein [Streptomyces olivaceoviridis]|uniref:hypothetical protein n=1 Tax=Streptomyces olivaceoviridis TaxID=1921 RepID=UPI0036F84846
MTGTPAAMVAGKVNKDEATDLYVLGQGYENGRTSQAAWFVRGGSTIKRGKYTAYHATQADYGATGVIADFGENGHGDLAVSDTPYDKGAGSVLVLRGGASGPSTCYRLCQSAYGVATAATGNDRFGHALSAGDTHHDGSSGCGTSTGTATPTCWSRVTSPRTGLLLHGSAKGVTTSGASKSDLDPAFPQ